MQCNKWLGHTYSRYQEEIRLKLNSMSNGDGAFWKLSKGIGGLEADRAQSAPCAEVLAEHFAENMTSGKGVEDRGFTPKNPFKIKFTSFKVQFKKVRFNKSIDPSKSANGVAPRFWKECSIELAPSTCKMFKYIVQKATYVSRWKVGRLSALHKRGSVKLAKNYRPLQVLEKYLGIL